MSMTVTPCCDFGSDKQHPYTGPLPVNHIDILGFPYRLCDFHQKARVSGMANARRPDARPVPRGGYAHRRYSRGCPA
jgi:hypothetical protein